MTTSNRSKSEKMDDSKFTISGKDDHSLWSDPRIEDADQGNFIDIDELLQQFEQKNIDKFTNNTEIIVICDQKVKSKVFDTHQKRGGLSSNIVYPTTMATRNNQVLPKIENLDKKVVKEPK